MMNKEIEDVVNEIMTSSQCPEHRGGKTRFLATEKITTLVKQAKEEMNERVKNALEILDNMNSNGEFENKYNTYSDLHDIISALSNSNKQNHVKNTR